MNPIVIHSRTAIHWQSGTDYCSFTPHRIPEQYIICSLYADNPLQYNGLREGCGWCYHNDVFNLGGTVVCNFNVIHPQRRNTKKGEAVAIAFYSIHFGKQTVVYSAASSVFQLSPPAGHETATLLSLSFPPALRTLTFITQEFFPKPRLVIAVIVPCAVEELGELVCEQVKWSWKNVSAMLDLWRVSLRSVCTGGQSQEGNR